MSKINFLKPDKQNLNTYLYSGLFLLSISILDVFINSFFKINITSFLPNGASFFLPLILFQHMEIVVLKMKHHLRLQRLLAFHKHLWMKYELI